MKLEPMSQGQLIPKPGIPLPRRLVARAQAQLLDPNPWEALGNDARNSRWFCPAEEF